MAVKNLTLEDNRWSWSFDDNKYRYYTNDQGEGIFYQKQYRETNRANECDVHQIAGT